jgi:hypothetical protein
MLTATMTRPTTISPTTSCDAKVNLIDSIDIAPIMEPKPRIISLEPISRRGRAKTPRKRPETAGGTTVPQTPTDPEAPRTAQASEPNSTVDDVHSPRSPSPSDVSYESQMSSGGASGTEYGVRSVNTTTEGSTQANGGRSTAKGKTITATIDVLKGGFLRGDQIPIKVHVKHTKHVRSLNGIIVTLYRQARVDMHPALPVAPNSKGDKKKTEDYYPKSRTGLGGLSLSSAGSSHLFRKDLSQSFAPLFVDPRTLTAEVKCTVRVPDESFPTISNVPGAMISFKYYIEVVVDIQGKLTGLDRMVANAGLVNVPSATGSTGMGPEDASNSMFSSWGGNFVDTDQIRREKGVISALFEVVVGTKDSERNGKRRQVQPQEPFNAVHEIPVETHGEPIVAEGYGQDYYDYDENGQYYDYNYDPLYYDIPEYEQYGHGNQPSYQAPTHMENEQGLSEKERVRRAEARLLPSQPPDVSGPSSAPSGAFQRGIQPSAPVLPEDDDPHAPYHAAGPSSSSLPAHPPPPFRAASSPQLSFRTNNTPPMQRRATGQTDDDSRTMTAGSSSTINATHHAMGAPSSPTNGTDTAQGKALPPIPPPSPAGASGPAPDYSPSSSSHVQPTDDKQEMQRRRLELERSAPPDERDEEGESSHHPSAPAMGANHTQNIMPPSAPILDEDDEGLVDAVRRGRGITNDEQGGNDRRRSEALPEYQR